MNSGMSGSLLIPVIQLCAMSVNGVHKCSKANRVLAALEQCRTLLNTTLRKDYRFNSPVKRFILLIACISSSKEVDNKGI